MPSRRHPGPLRSSSRPTVPPTQTTHPPTVPYLNHMVKDHSFPLALGGDHSLKLLLQSVTVHSHQTVPSSLPEKGEDGPGGDGVDDY